MAHFADVIKRHRRMDFKTIWGDFRAKRDPDEFIPYGSQIFHGYQGEGKTLSMIFYMYKLKKIYPKALIISNLNLSLYEPIQVNPDNLKTVMSSIDTKKQYIYYNDHQALMFALKEVRNGIYGVIFCIDEIHNYFHSHDSKSMPMWVVQVFSQQRKQYMVILGTVQMWENVIKAIREQVDNLIGCHKVWYFIRQTVVDPRQFETNYGEREAPIKKQGFFFMTKELREAYDTKQIINSGREIMGGNDLIPKTVLKFEGDQKRGFSFKKN